MAELTHQERLQPCLLDRLIDDRPNERQESRDQRVISVHRLREAVLRDLAWLLNATNLGVTEKLDEFPYAAQSVLNFGMPALAGTLLSSIDVMEFERRIHRVVELFEPRILRDTLRVRLVVADDQMSHNAMTFEIEGQLWAQPLPQQLYLKTEIDLELGEVKVLDYSRSS